MRCGASAEGRHVRDERLSRAANLLSLKRALDLVVSIPLAVLTLPLVLLLMTGSAVSFRASPLFFQRRLGRQGGDFWFVKIRSLPRNAPVAADKYEIELLQNTRWGSFLRHTHLDELPQLWLVVTGKMSLVGPRPEMPALRHRYESHIQLERLSVPPGLTGLWQISTSSDRLIAESPEFDQHYVRRWTLRLDLWILARTVIHVIGCKSINDLGQIPNWTGAAPHEDPASLPPDVAAMSTAPEAPHTTLSFSSPKQSRSVA